MGQLNECVTYVQSKNSARRDCINRQHRVMFLSYCCNFDVTFIILKLIWLENVHVSSVDGHVMKRVQNECLDPNCHVQQEMKLCKNL